MADAFDSIRKRINEAKEKAMSTKNKTLIAKVMARQVKQRTRIGKGVRNNGDSSYPLSSIERTRQYEDLRNRVQLSPETTPRKHNLTKSGQLLNGLNGRSINKGIEIYVKDQRADGKLNSKIIEGQRKLGRVFLNLSKFEINQLKRLIRTVINGEIDKEFR